jgi:hypothetical protein
MNNNLTAKIVGQLFITIGIISVLGIVFLIIFFIGYFQDIPSIIFFGPLNDISGSLEAILTAILASIILVTQGKRWLWLNLIGVVLSWVGAFIVTLDSLMAGDIIPKTTASILRIRYEFPSFLTVHDLHFGFGLIGIWLLIVIYQAFQTRSWPNHLLGLGLLPGFIMILGLAGNSPLGFVILYPLWCILLGRWILQGKGMLPNAAG